MRNERFHDGQRSVLEKQSKNLEAISAAHQAVDRRCVKRTKQRLKEQKQMICESQKKFNDQQKMVREIQRDEDRRWKLMQAKFYANEKKQLVRPGSSPAKKKVVSGEKAEAIYVDMLQSHSRNRGALAQFQQFVADNEKRTEANWRNSSYLNPLH